MITSIEQLWGQMKSISVTLETIVCSGCGIPFSLPENYISKLRENHTTFYCPNGCKQYFPGETEAEKLKREIKRREAEIAQLSSSKVQLESQLQKVAQGKCPCCGKTYKHLQSHMQKKHPHAIKK